MSQEKTQLNLEELVKSIFDRAIKIANSKIDSDYYFTHNVYGVEVKKNNVVNVYANIAYVTKFLEISESVSEGFNEYISDLERQLGHELSEDEVEEEWLRLRREQLNEINSNYAFYVYGKIQVDLATYYIGGGKLWLEIYPEKCTGDYCEAGLGIEVKLIDIPLDFILNYGDQLAESLAKILLAIVDIATL